ncbi:aminotransferase class I/II-fold pyridoxal phosphate-dependent enzyme, partial [Pseudonocardia sp. SID8383]
DEAHGLGVRGPGGRGLLAETGLAGADDVVATVTLSKALGSQGGAVLGPAAVTAHLVDSARSFIFDTGLAPAATGAALAAL